MDDKSKKLVEFLNVDLSIDSIKKNNDVFLSHVSSKHTRTDEVNKKIASLEKELTEAKSLKEKIEIIQIKKYICMKELQLYIGKSRAWVNDKILTNNFPKGSKKSGRENLFKREAVDKWFDEEYFE